jgi:hypothetical protein
LEYYEASRFAIEFLYKPSVPDNISNWRVFEGDEHIISFLTNEENFRDLAIDDDVFQKILVEEDNQDANPIGGNNSNQPKIHTMPQGVVSLENLFDLREKFKKPKNTKTNSLCPSYEVINLGTMTIPKTLTLGNHYLLRKRRLT